MYKTIPAVFAVEDTYQIMVRTDEEALVWVEIGDQCFYDHSNGILRSNTTFIELQFRQHCLIKQDNIQYVKD